MKITDYIKNGYSSLKAQPPYSGHNGHGQPQGLFAGILRPFGGSTYNWAQEVGNPYENSAVAACINWAAKAFQEADLKLYREEDEGEMDVIDSPILGVLQDPNDNYGASELWSATLHSWMVDGNAYWYVEKNALGIPIGLHFLPYYAVTPAWPTDGTVFISHYNYKVNGMDKRLELDEVIHFRNGIDPFNTRRGLNPLLPALKEIAVDNEASIAGAALMKNVGMPGLHFTPDPNASISNEQREQIRQMGREKMTGDRRGEMLIMPIPGDMKAFGFAPDQMALDVIRRLPEERICACYGIPPSVVGLGAGLDRSTYSNMEQSRQAAYESFMKPLWKIIETQLNSSLLPMFLQEDLCFRFDLSGVAALKDSQQDLHDRIRLNYQSGIITLEEARELLGYQKAEETLGRDLFFTTPRKQEPNNVDK